MHYSPLNAVGSPVSVSSTPSPSSHHHRASHHYLQQQHRQSPLSEIHSIGQHSSDSSDLMVVSHLSDNANMASPFAAPNASNELDDYPSLGTSLHHHHNHNQQQQQHHSHHHNSTNNLHYGNTTNADQQQMSHLAHLIPASISSGTNGTTQSIVSVKSAVNGNCNTSSNNHSDQTTKRSSSSASATKSSNSYNSKSNNNNSDHHPNHRQTNGSGRLQSGGGKKTKGRVKIKMEFIDNKLRRYTTFSKRKTGIMKKAYELSTLTGTQVMLLVASETGHVYTFATRKLQPMITSDAGKALIQTCLNSPDSGLNGGPDVVTTNGHVSMTCTSVGNGLADSGLNDSRIGLGGSNGSLSSCPTPTNDQRMSSTGFEETDLSYSVSGEDLNDKGIFSGCLMVQPNGTLANANNSNGQQINQSNQQHQMSHFFINGQAIDPSDLDELDDAEDDEEDEEADDIDDEESYMSGQLSDIDLTRFIGSDLASSSNHSIQKSKDILNSINEPLLWDNIKPPTATVSDTTKINLNLKLQQKRTLSNLSSQDNANKQSRHSQANRQQYSGQSELKQQLNEPKDKKYAKKKGLKEFSLSNNALSNSSGTGLGHSSNFNNFDPASFLDSCFNTGLQQSSPNQNESGQLMDTSIHNLDKILSEELADLTGFSSRYNNNNNNNSKSALTNQNKSNKNNSKMFAKNSNKTNSNNCQQSIVPNEYQIQVQSNLSSTSQPMMNKANQVQSTSQMPLSSVVSLSESLPCHPFQTPLVSAQVNKSPSQQQQEANYTLLRSNGTRCSNNKNNITTSLNISNSLANNSKQQQTELGNNDSGKQSSCNLNQQLKAANLNTIINNLSQNNNSGNIANLNANHTIGNSTQRNCNSATNKNSTLPINNGSFLNSLSSNTNLNQFGAFAAAAQQLLSGNIILCTTPTPTISLPSLDPSNSAQLLTLGTTSHSSGTSSSTTSLSQDSTTLLLPTTSSTIQTNSNSSESLLNQQQSQSAGQFIYNALAGRLVYTPNSNVNRPNNSCPVSSFDSPNSGLLPLSTFITSDGQQLILNMPTASTHSSAQSTLQIPTLTTQGNDNLNLLLSSYGNGFSQLVTSSVPNSSSTFITSSSSMSNALLNNANNLVMSTSSSSTHHNNNNNHQHSSQLRVKQESVDSISSLFTGANQPRSALINHLTFNEMTPEIPFVDPRHSISFKPLSQPDSILFNNNKKQRTKK